ncbi:MAG TPA: CARDB domain-containing protein [Tepidisphaeraceae bacterium]
MRSSHRSSIGKQKSAMVMMDTLESRRLLSAAAGGTVDLTAALNLTSPSSFTIKPGDAVSFSINVANDGSGTAKGSMKSTISTSANSDGSDATTLWKVSNGIIFGADASLTFNYTLKTSRKMMPGVYYIVADIDSNNKFHETDTTNNVSVAPQTLTVQSLYPSVAGNSALTLSNTKGANKGSTTNMVLEMAESATGALSGTATVNGNPGAVSGSVSLTGALTLQITSGGVTYKIKGTDKNNNITGKFTSSNGGGGTVATGVGSVGTLEGTYQGTETSDATGTTKDITLFIATEDTAGNITGSITDSTGTYDIYGTYAEATGDLNFSLTATGTSTSYTVNFMAHAFDGGISGNYVDEIGNDPGGTFNVSEDVGPTS